MAPTAVAPAATPTTYNPNLPYGGQPQASSDAASASSILNYLPGEIQRVSGINPADTSILPSVNVKYNTISAPTAPTIDPRSFGSDLIGYNAAVQGAERGLVGSENSAFAQAVKDYQSNVARYGDFSGVYGKLANQYGLPGFQSDMDAIQHLLDNLTVDVNAQTTQGGGLMSEAARDEIESNRRVPLETALSAATRQYQTGQSQVDALLGAYESSLQQALKPEEAYIAGLPGLFERTNSTAEAGYGQGAGAIENTIQNALQRRQLDAEFGRLGTGGGGIADVFSKGGNGGGQQFAGVAFKNPTQRGAGGYNFTVDGKPASAVTWATQNGQPPSQVIAYMAQNGDATAGQAYRALITNPNMSMAELAQQFPSLAWGVVPPAAPPPTPKQIADQNAAAVPKILNPENSTNFMQYFWNQLTHPWQML